MKKNAARRRQKRKQKMMLGAVAGVLAVGALGTTLYFTVLKDVFGGKSNKIVVTDINGSEVSYEPEELAQQIDVPTFYEGITINGVSVAGKTKDEVKTQLAAELNKPVSDVVDVKFQVGNDLIPMGTEGLTLTTDLDDIVEKAYNYGRTSTLPGDEGLKDRYNTINALKKTPVDFVTTYTLDTSAVDTLAHQALDPLEKEKVEAYASGYDLDTLSFIIEDSQEGFTVDVDKAIADVKERLNNSDYVCVVPVSSEVIEPETSGDYLRNYLCLVSTTTSTTSGNENRNTNIRLICESINGLVLQPGEQFDFNKHVGQRTEEKGYKEAHGIFNGDMRDELGGGICQANTMLYQSVTKADLQVDERKNHTIPSTYVDKGTDATVTWESPNFKFTNNTDYPIAIHAWYKDRKVTVEIYGRPLEDGMTIDLKGELVREIPPTGTTYVADSSLPVGEKKTVTGSRTGYDYKSWKIYYDKDGNEIKREEYFPSHYPMRNAEIHVGVKGPDGTIYKMDSKTGKVDVPAGVTNPPSSSEDTQATPPPESSANETPAPTQPEATNPPEVTPDPQPQPDNGGGEGGGEGGGGEGGA
ncbi:MAG: VanW family protein [Clostridiales bacterium]|nr:VanW family protein [Clostridiales bacterium]